MTTKRSESVILMDIPLMATPSIQAWWQSRVAAEKPEQPEDQPDVSGRPRTVRERLRRRIRAAIKQD